MPIRRLLALTACAALISAPASSLGGHEAGPKGFPVPHEENQVFFVQRSTNANTIVYAARLDVNGVLDRRRPIDVYWRRFNDGGERKELSFLERNAAFGVKTERISDQPLALKVRVVSYSQRSAVLKLVDGRPLLEATVAGEPSRLLDAYLHIDESGVLPRVTLVELRGVSLATGEEIKEKFVP